MKYSIDFTNRFKKSLRKGVKRGLDPTLIEKAVEKLANEGKLPPSYKSHKLHGNLERLIVENSATSIALFKYFIMLLQPLHSANEIDSSTQRSRIFNPTKSYL
jgi:hypothetical protein